MVCRGDCREAKNAIGNILDYLSDKTSIRDLDDDPSISDLDNDPAYYYDEFGDRIDNVRKDKWDKVIDDYLEDPFQFFHDVDSFFVKWFNKNEIDPDNEQTCRDVLQKMLAMQNHKIMQRQDILVNQNSAIMQRQEILIKQNSAIIQRQETLIKVLKAQTDLIAIFARFYIDTQRPD